jgi:amidohydrolase
MVREGALDNPKVDAVFGLHVGITPLEAGSITFRPGGLRAASDSFTITVKGRQTHGAMPWDGVDSVVTAAQIILGLQTIVSRQTDLTRAPAVVTVGIVRAGVQGNIIPQETVLSGTIRTLDARTRKDVHERVRRTARTIAASAGAEAEVSIGEGNPVVVNDAALTRRMTPVLVRCAGPGGFAETPPQMTAEDFALFAEKVPGMFFFLGIGPADGDPAKTFPNHSPYFRIDEGALPFGVRAMVHLAVERLLEKN